MRSRSKNACAAFALAATLALPTAALAHDQYDDPFQNHPFKWAATAGYVAGYAADQLVFRPLHWILNQKPVSTVTGHDKMDTRQPPDDLESIS
jgi:hypothetical protein